MNNPTLARAYENFAWLLFLPLLPLTILDRPEWASFFLLLPALWLLRLLVVGRLTPATPLNGSLWLLILMLGVSLWATYDIDRSIGKVTAVFYGIALLWMLADTAGRTPRHFTLATAAFLLGGLGVAGLALLGTQWSAKLPLIGRAALFVRNLQPSLPGGIPQFNANQIAGTLLWLVPLAIALALTAVVYRQEMRQAFGRWLTPLVQLFVLGTAVVLTSVLLLTQSRGGYIGLGLALGLMLILAAGRWRTWLIGAGLLLLVVGGGYTAVVGPAQGLSPLFEAAGAGADIDSAGDISTLQGRVEIWSRAIYAAQDFPFTGMGMNNFREVVHILYPLFLISPTTDIAHAHNHLLHTAVELGLPGLIAYLALWFGLAVMLAQMWRRQDNPLWRGFIIGAAGSLLGYFAYGMFDAVALGAKPGFLLWFLWGLIAAGHRLAVSRKL